jgi:hypothetical protein
VLLAAEILYQGKELTGTITQAYYSTEVITEVKNIVWMLKHFVGSFLAAEIIDYCGYDLQGPSHKLIMIWNYLKK